MNKKLKKWFGRIVYVSFLLILTLLLYIEVRSSNLDNLIELEVIDLRSEIVDRKEINNLQDKQIKWLKEELEYRTDILYKMFQERGGLYEYYNDSPNFLPPNIDMDILPYYDYEVPLEGR